MAITNAMIIATEAQRLMEEGKIKPTGRMLKFETSEGVTKIPEAEAIHTFNRWKELGYSVKKGEHAIAKFQIWKYGKGHTDEEEPNEETRGYCFRKTACFFAAHQVEPIRNTIAAEKPA